MNKPETERQLKCVQCMAIDQYGKESVKQHVCDECFESIGHIEVPKGKTAVTFYIPEGMNVGRAIIESVERLNRRSMSAAEWIEYAYNEEIQEAIDNTFPENK